MTSISVSKKRKRKLSDMERSASLKSRSSGGSRSTRASASSKKRRPTKKFMLAKIPKWLADEWFNDDKFPVTSPVAKLMFSTDASVESTVRVLTPPAPKSAPLSSAQRMGEKTSSVVSKRKRKPSAVKLRVPREYTIKAKEVHRRNSMHHGVVKKLKADQHLVFTDKPKFQVDCEVRVQDDLCPDVLNATVKGITDDRSYDIQMEGTMRIRKNVHEDYMEFRKTYPKANRCKKSGMVSSYGQLVPVRNAEYQKFILKRALKGSTKKKTRLISKEQREKVYRGIRDEKRAQFDATYSGGAKARAKAGGKSTGKRVRKTKEHYRDSVFAAFSETSEISQKEIERRTHEPWIFLKDVINEFCESQGRGAEGKVWKLKADYQLHSDATT